MQEPCREPPRQTLHERLEGSGLLVARAGRDLLERTIAAGLGDLDCSVAVKPVSWGPRWTLEPAMWIVFLLLPLALAACTRESSFVFLREESFSSGDQRHTLKIFLHEKTGLEFVLVPAGEFLMGSPEEEQGRHDDEGPQHRARVGSFLVGRTEVTQAAWDLLMGSNESTQKGPDLPVDGVSWSAARIWCRRAGLRLPSEAEWEYACRAGTVTPFCFGDDLRDLSLYARFKGRHEGPYSRPWDPRGPMQAVLPNAFGLFDMHGGVFEWCVDFWRERHPGGEIGPRAWFDPTKTFRVCRGGSANSIHQECRSAYRLGLDPTIRFTGVGFRAAASLPAGLLDSLPASPRPGPPTIGSGAMPPSVLGFRYLRKEPFACGGRKHEIELYMHLASGLLFVLVPSGEFLMGSPDEEQGRRDDEGPRHRVRVVSFLLCRKPVSKRAWSKVMGIEPDRWTADDPVQVNWNAAVAWCLKAGLRLPSEAEWEYACRALTTTPYCFGLWSDAFDSEGSSSWPPRWHGLNTFGLFHVHGGVWEWCQDNWHVSYLDAPADGRAWLGPDPMRVLRGGAGPLAPEWRSARRNAADPADRLEGFRPACSLD